MPENVSIQETERGYEARLFANPFFLTFRLSLADLQYGKSLGALKNAWVKKLLKYHGNILDRQRVNELASSMIFTLRPLVEERLAAQALMNKVRQDDES